jgi:hypothetical protein
MTKPCIALWCWHHTCIRVCHACMLVLSIRECDDACFTTFPASHAHAVVPGRRKVNKTRADESVRLSLAICRFPAMDRTIHSCMRAASLIYRPERRDNSWGRIKRSSVCALIIVTKITSARTAI